MFKILTGIKKFFIHMRSSIKLIFLVVIVALFITGIISIFYRPVYAVSLNGELLGYTSSKTDLQKKINSCMEPNTENNIAFVDIKSLPEYSLCLLKRNTKINDDEILDKVTSDGKKYYEYYAIVEGEKEKYYVGTKAEAEEVIARLKKKNSGNIKKIAYTQIFNDELKDFTDIDKIVKKLYVKKKSYYGGHYAICYEKIDLGIALALPIKGHHSISSRFGPRRNPVSGREGFHTGTDITSPTGTPIYAAAGGTVVFADYRDNGYGKYIIIKHANGVETLYAHCSKLNVSVGDVVKQNQKIGEVGSTGNSTGPHLHFEVRAQGKRIDPQNYVYQGEKKK